MAEESLGLLIYGPAGSGKTSLGLTGPTPTLVLDAEQTRNHQYMMVLGSTA